jgi:DNA invertase Pin-like site-specific DNA recombinase
MILNLTSERGGVAEFERAMIRERQLEGVQNAKQAGKYRGRQSTTTAANVKAIRDRAAAGESKSALAREFMLSRQTIYNILSTGSTNLYFYSPMGDSIKDAKA